MSFVEIINGPSKFDLMQALFIRKPYKTSVTFSLQENVGLTAYIDSIKDLDNSGEYWRVEGSVGNDKKFTADYRTNSHTGLYKVFD